ncbi:rhodanese-like domain-containing protein [Corynebacterium ulceribovis]|uniref:rhodanese-like domain-containing protein n=1 Tax=Corynebacterium ulceribovis TaxID=487732 RepID=UPI00036C6055|nr:rhodanese-like domain-containing protein [Corynebacterium ulceribovis]
MEAVAVTEVPKDAQLIDVRSPEEFAELHAIGSVNIPMEQMMTRYGELDLDQDIYLICRSGGRSAQVGSWLERNGIDAINVRGGMIDWEFHNLPREAGA